ncbi:MAG: glycoside hydrolase family 5 protein [Chloroflexota bacterium]
MRFALLAPFFGLLGFMLILSSCVGNTPVTSAPDAEASKAIFALNERLGRGVNLGNALEAPNEGEWGMTLEADFFRLIAEAGFSTVRVPIRWSAHASETEPYTIDETFFERIDWVIEQAKANNLNAIINMHHYGEIMSEPNAHSERFLALWSQIANRYQNEPPTLLFELLNEPHNALSSSRWNELLAAGIAQVRQTNPTRAIIVGPVQWNSISELPWLELPNDPNLIVTFHYYAPFEFTHQGAEWVDGANAWLGTDWSGADAEKEEIQSEMDDAIEWATKHNRPLFLGEFGAYSKADQASRDRWTSFVAQAAQERGISFTYWEFGAGFGVYDRTTASWNEGLRRALLGE